MGVHTKKKSRIFSSLSVDLLGLVINKVKDKEDRNSLPQNCKQWFKLEGLDRSSLSLDVNKPGFSLPALTRFPNIVNLTLWDFKTHTDLEFIAKPKGDGCILSRKGLCALGDGCPKLSEVEIIGPNATGDSGVDELLHSAQNLEPLVLLKNSLISGEALRAIGFTSSISILELIHCYNITDEGLAFSVNGSTSKTLKKFVLYTCPKITNTGVELLGKMCSLEHLELSSGGEMSQITDIGGVAISAIRTLKELRLNHLNVSNPTIVALAQNFRNLEILDIGGSERDFYVL
ncbi:uncharacterized protein LOC112184484 [Rosa chinensis]|uniref:uncharacterized protein LOC112184484 n=1 Tax=Rosa chinensis TaxID=74649 RepID=UPI000D08FB10|nr:uncharacterized protein LOC112184484 [Rosa chinensis]